MVLALLLDLADRLFDRPGATLPPPTVVWTEARDLILDPFFDYGSQDMGLGWRVLVSLQRVAIGFGLAAVVGILLGALIGQSDLGHARPRPDLPGAAHRAAARLAAAVAGGLPRLPAPRRSS